MANLTAWLNPFFRFNVIGDVMALPEHKYFTLKQAAKKASCEVEDLIHFAAIGLLQLCTKIPSDGFYGINNIDEENDEHQSVNLRVEYTFKPECLPDDSEEIQSDNSIVCSYETKYFSNTDVVKLKNKEVDYISGLRISGLLAIYDFDIEEVEQKIISGEDSFYVTQFLIPRSTYENCPDYYGVFGVYASGLIEIKIESLLITSDEMSLLLKGGKEVDYEHSTQENEVAHTKRRENFSKHKASLVRSLTELAFADDGGILKLSMESIAEQLQEKFKRAEIDYDDISPYNLRNYLIKLKRN